MESGDRYQAPSDAHASFARRIENEKLWLRSLVALCFRTLGSLIVCASPDLRRSGCRARYFFAAKVSVPAEHLR
jgi:hypothetical protein